MTDQLLRAACDKRWANARREEACYAGGDRVGLPWAACRRCEWAAEFPHEEAKIEKAIAIVEAKAGRHEVMAAAPRTTAESRQFGDKHRREAEAMRLLVAFVRERL